MTSNTLVLAIAIQALRRIAEGQIEGSKAVRAEASKALLTISSEVIRAGLPMHLIGKTATKEARQARRQKAKALHKARAEGKAFKAFQAGKAYFAEILA